MQTAIFSYLKVFGLNQYGRAFAEAGLAELEAVARLSETEALEFLEHLRVYPGHRLRLLRAVDCLRHAAIGAERRDASQMLEDDACLDRLCAQNEELSKEKHETESENSHLRQENNRLVGLVRQQAQQLQRSRDRTAELEELVRSQTEQVNFLAEQLQQIAEENPSRENELYNSYRGSFDRSKVANDADDDWASAQPFQLPERTEDLKNAEGLFNPPAFAAPGSAGAPAVPSPPPLHCGSAADTSRATSSQPGVEVTPPPSRGHADAPTRQRGFSPPARSRLAMSLDSAQIKECLGKFDVDHIIRCLATAIQNKIILSLGRPRPHSATSERLQDCIIFLEPACKDKLLAARDAMAGAEGRLVDERGAPQRLSCSFTFNQTMSGQPANPLNGFAVRTAPSSWDIYGFLRDVMVNFRLEPEVSVITLFYLDRFTSMCGVSVTPDNWQRLTITSMMLASKVWNDESFENIEFSQLCPLYTLDEINTFERIFLKCVGYNMAVKGSEYAKTYFLLRTLGAKDSADFDLAPMDPVRASRLQERCLEKQIEFRDRYTQEGGEFAWTL